jgi:hypothetical protein
MKDDKAQLLKLQRETFGYFLTEVNPANGLVPDKSRKRWPSSITAVGLALASYPIGVERKFMTRDEAVQITRTTLRFFRDGRQGKSPGAIGDHGFYYHFLGMKSGRRAWRSEISTIDTTFLLAGALTAAAYFNRDTEAEQDIRQLADELYRRADWQWARHGGATVTHGYRPGVGFIRHRWEGYNEALLLYVLGLGSPTYPLPPESYQAWLSTYVWRKVYDYEYVYAGPLFIHQLSHIWIDFRGIQDAYMREKGIDYFENSRRATYAQRAYAIHNPGQFANYDEDCWGFTASDGPGWKTLIVKGVKRQFFEYIARGIPDGPDDGTLAPWAAAASLPFAPEIVLPALRYYTDEAKLKEGNPYGFTASFNPTYPDRSRNAWGWVSRWHHALNQGPIVCMIENHLTGLTWRLMRESPYVVEGLRRAGFRGGWL